MSQRWMAQNWHSGKNFPGAGQAPGDRNVWDGPKPDQAAVILRQAVDGMTILSSGMMVLVYAAITGNLKLFR
jgi:hypothetical protein